MPPLGGSGLEGLTSGAGGGGGVPDSPLILQGLGVVGAPELTFIGDLDTGIYSPAADQMGLVAGGIEVARASEDVEGQFIVSPGQFLGSAALPALAIGDGDTGFYETFDDTLFLSIGGVNRFVWADAANSFQGAVGGAGWVRNEVASATNPTIGPSSSDSDTGIGSFAADALSLVAGGVEGMRLAESEGSVVNSFSGVLLGFANNSPELRNIAASATVPTLIPNKANAISGIGQNAAGEVSIIGDGVEGFRVAESAAVITNTIFGNLVAAGGGGAGPMMKNEGPSSTNPVFVPNQADPDTGLGRDAVDSLSLIAGGVGCLRVREIGGARAVGLYTTTPIVQQTGVAVSAAAIHAACVAIGLFTA